MPDGPLTGLPDELAKFWPETSDMGSNERRIISGPLLCFGA